MSHAPILFATCVQSINGGELIRRDSRRDKEFHFQNWFKARLASLDVNFEEGGRNSYPDFRLVHVPEGFELKGLAYPGREANYDCNSQVPRGEHNGRTVYYVFGRYPAKPDGDTYPVLDLVFCHGAFLNADSDYRHKNKSFRGFGSYGDIMVRDRKMYVAPTPFVLATGTAHRRTLILPASDPAPAGMAMVGELRRREVNDLVSSYAFDLHTNELTTTKVGNPSAGREHIFAAYRLSGDSTEPVEMRNTGEVLRDMEASAEHLDDEENA